MMAPFALRAASTYAPLQPKLKLYIACIGRPGPTPASRSLNPSGKLFLHYLPQQLLSINEVQGFDIRGSPSRTVEKKGLAWSDFKDY